MLEVEKDAKRNMPMSILGSMHKLIEEAHYIRSVRTMEGQVDKPINEMTTSVGIGEQGSSGVSKVRLVVKGGE